MKLTNLIWVLALAGSVAACNSGPPVQGCAPGEIVSGDGRCESEGGGTGGSNGGGGASGEGACTNDADQAVYADLEYVDSNQDSLTGIEAASAIASDCVFGSANSVPENPGCATEAGNVLSCAIAGSCDDATVASLRSCVEDCQQDVIMEITGMTLTNECNACYGNSEACSLAFCSTSGCSNPTSIQCICCQCENGCTPGFDVCSGFPPTGECEQCD